MKLIHYSDAGHGWVAVKRKVLVDLGLIDKVSRHSYQSKTGSTVYLEEDCDAGLLLGTLKDRSIAYQLASKSSDKTSPIRSYPRFKA